MSIRPTRCCRGGRRVTARTLPLLWSGALILSLGSCGEPPAAPEEVLRPVRTVVVAAGSGEQQVTFAGVARAGVESQLSFRVPGTVLAVDVDLGDRVQPGQVLARLDATDFELKVEEAEAALALAQASLRQGDAEFDRTRALYESNNASKSQLDAARAAAESGRAQLEAREKQLQQARQQVGYTVLRAPQAGAIAAVNVEVNEGVAAGQTALLLTSIARPEVTVAVPEMFIAAVQKGQTVMVAFDALPGRKLTGRISEVGVAALGSGTTFDVRARLEESDAAVRAGMAAEVTFHFPGPDDAGLTVPLVAVGEDRQGRYVFVVEDAGDGTGVVHRRGVEIGDLATGGLQVRQGLAAGERVVTAGVRRLADGMRVRMQSEAEAP